MLLLSLLSPAFAAPFVLSVSDEISTGLGGGWARAWPNEDGTWRFLWSAGGDYVLLPMTEDLTVTDRDRTPLTGRTNLADHGIARCPDGSFLHVASANVDTWNDSAYAFRYDADFTKIGEDTVEERVTTRQHNDMAVICSGPLSGVAFAGGGGSYFFPIAADGTVGEVQAMEDAPELMGGSLYYEAETDTILAINFAFGGPLVVTRYSPDLVAQDRKEIDGVTEAGLRGYWAQGLLRVGDVYVLAHMARDEAEGFAADEGNVWLAFFDAEWNFLERAQISRNAPPTGGMRPGLARRGDQLLVFYDKEVQPRLYDVRLDLAAMGVDGTEDSGGEWPADDTAAGDDTGREYPSMKDGCGCDSGGAGVGTGLLLAGLAFTARRRR